MGRAGPQPAKLASNSAECVGLFTGQSRLHSTLGRLRVFQWRWAEAEEAYKRAISLEPTNAFPHMTYPILCSFLGRHEEALLHALKAVELDPLDLMTNFRLLQANYYSRRYDEAVCYRADARLALYLFVPGLVFGIPENSLSFPRAMKPVVGTVRPA